MIHDPLTVEDDY